MWDGFTQKMYDGFAWLANKIMVPINAILGWLQSFKDFIVETYNSFISWFDEKLTGLVTDVIDWGTDLLNTAYNWGLEFFEPKIQIALDFIQTEMSWLFDMATMTNEFFYTADYFLPLHEFFIGLTGLLTLWALCLIIKVVVKIIPTVY